MNAPCTCGHTEREHLYEPPASRRFTSGLVPGGCSADACPCKVYRRDRNYIPESKTLTPREKREQLTQAGAKWLNSAGTVGGWAAMKEIGCSESMITRLRRAIEDGGPYAEGGTLERLKGGELGRQAWLTLLGFLRDRAFVFGEDKPCPLCGRKGAR
jgi:hypothetical protein